MTQMNNGQDPFSMALKDVIAERQRHQSVEGWTPEHDDEHSNGELILAGTSYALNAMNPCGRSAPPPFGWPWAAEWWKPKNPRRDLVRAAALIVAEIERLDRADERQARMLARHDGRQ